MSTEYSPYSKIKTLIVMNEYFQNLYDFFQTQTLCDITLSCDDGVEISAHKVVLALASPMLLAMFNGDFKESKQINIPLKNIDSLILKSIVTCAYTLHMDIDENNIEKLMIASEYFEFNYAKDLCYNYVQKNIDANNCITFLTFAEPTSQKGLYNYSFLYCLDNFKTILESESQTNKLYKLNYEDIFKIISNDHLMVEPEDKLFDFIVEWIKYDTEERSKYLSNLLNYLRLPLISNKNAFLRICDEPMVKSQHDCLIDIMKNYISVDVDENIRKATIRKPHLYEPNIIFAIRGPLNGDDSYVTYMDLRREDDLNWKSCDYSFFIPPHRHAILVVSETGIILAVGGYNKSGRWENYCYELDLTSTSKKWLPTTPMRTLRQDFAVATQGRYIYVVGGYGVGDLVGPLNSIEYYNTYSKVWTEIPEPLPTPRWGCGAIVHDDCLYVVGGHDGKNSLSSVERYNLKKKYWTQCNPMPVATIVTDITIRGNNLYILGDVLSPCVYKMNLNNLEWNKLPNMITTVNCSRNFVVTIENDLFVVTNVYEGPYKVSCQRFIAEKNIWQVVEPSNKLSHYHHIILFNDKKLKTFNIDIL